MKRAPAAAAAVLGCAGLALVALGAGAGADSQPPGSAYSVTVPEIAADGPPGTGSRPATATPGKVEAIRTSCYRDGAGAVHAVGEVANGLDHPVSYTRLNATLLSGGGVVASQTGTASLATVGTGGVSPFEIVLPSGSPAYDTCRIEVSQFEDPGTTTPLIPFGLEARPGLPHTDAQGAIHVPGTVRNRAGQLWRFVRVYVVLYDESGNVRMVTSADAQPRDVSSGLESAFEVVVPADQQLSSFGVRAFAWGERPEPTPTPTPSRTGPSQ